MLENNVVYLLAAVLSLMQLALLVSTSSNAVFGIKFEANIHSDVNGYALFSQFALQAQKLCEDKSGFAKRR